LTAIPWVFRGGQDVPLEQQLRETSATLTNGPPVQEAVARFFSILVEYHDAVRTPAARSQMVAEVRAVVEGIVVMGLGIGETDSLVLRPVEAELLARYGPEVGTRINAEFVEAFEGWGTT
jgi:hypothetical protein